MLITRRMVLGVLLIFPSVTNAGIESREQLFKALCIGEKSVGFNWKQNGWVFTRFAPEKYLVEKLTIDNVRTPFCVMNAQDKKGYESKSGAVRIRML